MSMRVVLAKVIATPDDEHDNVLHTFYGSNARDRARHEALKVRGNREVPDNHMILVETVERLE
jgi:hypothetical protein